MELADRRLNGELAEGAVDGKYKKINSRERGGHVEPTTAHVRAQLMPLWYDIAEAPVKYLPDGRTASQL